LNNRSSDRIHVTSLLFAFPLNEQLCDITKNMQPAGTQIHIIILSTNHCQRANCFYPTPSRVLSAEFSICPPIRAPFRTDSVL